LPERRQLAQDARDQRKTGRKMAAIEEIIAWCKQEQSRLAHQLEQLQSGWLRTYEKHAQAPGWLEIDTTEQSIALCRQYISELSAIVARYPAIVPTAPVSPAPVPHFVSPVRQPAAAPAAAPSSGFPDATHPDWTNGWGVIKGQPPKWQFAGIYSTHAEANEAAAKAGEGYYARWGSYNEGTKEFTSGPQFDRAG
jgi:hypothetical protein